MPSSSKPRRIDQLLSSCGYCSRSEARHWVKKGRVKVHSELVRSPAEKADPHTVTVDEAPLDHPDGLLLVLNKPAGHVCSKSGKEGKTVYELIPERWLKRNPPVTTVGRLDRDTTGVLLFTDQGHLVHHWTSPKHHVTKRYEVTVDRPLEARLVELFGSGELLLDDEDKPCLPAQLEMVSDCQARLELVEGRFHQVKRMFESQGYAVVKLHRSRFGDYDVEGVSEGEWKLLPL